MISSDGYLSDLTVSSVVLPAGNIYFGWLSIHESVIWAMVGPVFVLMMATLVNLVLVISASLSVKDHVKDHVEGFGNLRSVAYQWVIGECWIAQISRTSWSNSVRYLLRGM